MVCRNVCVLFVSVCVPINVCGHVHVYAYFFMCVHVYMSDHVCVFLCMCFHVCIYICLCISGKSGVWECMYMVWVCL